MPDISFVEAAAFTYQVPCFNATVPEFELPSNASSSNSTENGTVSENGGKSGLSGGAIAGIVIGVVAGIALLAGAAFMIWRLRNQRERLRAQGANPRAVKWDGQEAVSGKASQRSSIPSEQHGDVALGEMGNQAGERR
jgi:hypothetical protein